MLWSMASNSAKNADSSEAPLLIPAQETSVLPLTSMTAIRIAGSGPNPKQSPPGVRHALGLGAPY